MDHSDFNSPSAIEDLLQNTIANFHLIMIHERFLESLVLLKLELNWEFEDLAAFIYEDNLEDNRSELSPEINETIAELNAGNIKLKVGNFTNHLKYTIL